MQFAGFKNTRRSTMNTILEIKIKDFPTYDKFVIEQKYIQYENYDPDFCVWFSATVLPKGIDKETRGWLLVHADADLNGRYNPTNIALLWIVSIIDIEGKSRFPRSFHNVLSDGLLRSKTYLERSFLLGRADEFLPDGVLTLHYDIHFSWSGVSVRCIKHGDFHEELESAFTKVFRMIPRKVIRKIGDETLDPSNTFTAFSLESNFFTSLQFYEHIQKSGFHGDIFMDLPFDLDSKSQSTDNLEHVWVFDAHPDKFLLSLDERKDSVGARLLKASSWIRRCVDTPMKEQRNKRIIFSDTDGQTFRIVLFFLMFKGISSFPFHQLVKVYKFSHKYEMNDLQRRCAESMAETLKTKRNFATELDIYADLYSDEYLSELLQTFRHENKDSKSDLSAFRLDDLPNSDCFI